MKSARIALLVCLLPVASWGACTTQIVGDDFIISGCNVHIRDGSGDTDGAVNGLGNLTAGFARAVRLVQTGLVRSYALLILGGAVTVLGYLLWAR